MKFLVFAAIAGVASAGSLAKRGGLSPVTRVAELLKSLSEKTEAEGKKEEELYEKFMCWGKSISAAKAASNKAAAKRIDMLTKYIADLDAGRIELTSERVDLEKDVNQLTADVESAKAMREKENADYKAAKAEMEKALSALKEALTVLDEATAEHKKGALLALRGKASANAQQRAAEGAALARAVELGERFLTKEDSTFLRRLLTGDVPKADWKKLNRKATFKKRYEARSVKIQGVLEKLLQTFEGNLNDANAKEAEAVSMYDKLSAAKLAELESSRDALNKMKKEKGARSLSKEEAEEEKSSLELQVKNDEGYIQQLKDAMDEKTAEWKERQELRAGEIAAISKALAIIRSDDARDVFARSLKSQGFSLIQETEGTSSGRRNSASMALRNAADAAGDLRLSALAATLARENSHFDKVIAAIETMHAKLLAEEQSDLKKKETCEADRAKDTREAIVTSRSMDEQTDLMSSLKADVEELKANIAEKQEQLTEAGEQLASATANRKTEHEEFLVAEKDDKDAIELLSSSIVVLKEFYTENGLMLTQRRAQGSKQPAAVAGEAPPPPPPTWELPYGGNTEESTGILAIMEMIKEDIIKDLTDAQAGETEAAKVYKEAKAALTQEQNTLSEAISSLNTTMGEKIENILEVQAQRRTAKSELQAVIDKIDEATPGCDFFMINFPVRTSNRQLEMDGLMKAKAILQGAVFGTPADENREIKPGDAFLQRVQRHKV